MCGDGCLVGMSRPGDDTTAEMLNELKKKVAKGFGMVEVVKLWITV